MMQPKTAVPLQITVSTKLIVIPKAFPVKANSVGKPASMSAVSNAPNTKTITSVLRSTPLVVAINVKDNECVVILRDEIKAALIEDEF